MTDFPATIPAPTPSGFTAEGVDPRRKTPMSDGTSKIRAIRRGDAVNFGVAWQLDDDELAALRTFLASVGAGEFNMTIAAPWGMQAIPVRVVSPEISVTPAGMLWKVTARLYCRDIGGAP